MANETWLTLAGNLTASPKLGETRSGAAFAKLRVASTSRIFDRSESQWRDGDTVFLDVTCWRKLAEHAAATLERGDRVLIFGRLRQRSYEDAQGVRHTVHEVDAESLGPDLTRYAAQMLRPGRREAAASPRDSEDPVVASEPQEPAEAAA